MVTSPQAVIGHRFLSCMNIVASKVMASLKKIIVNLLIFAFLFLCVFSITKVIGIFKRADFDHKYIVIESDREIEDFSELTEEEKEELYR